MFKVIDETKIITMALLLCLSSQLWMYTMFFLCFNCCHWVFICLMGLCIKQVMLYELICLCYHRTINKFRTLKLNSAWKWFVKDQSTRAFVHFTLNLKDKVLSSMKDSSNKAQDLTTQDNYFFRSFVIAMLSVL